MFHGEVSCWNYFCQKDDTFFLTLEVDHKRIEKVEFQWANISESEIKYGSRQRSKVVENRHNGNLKVHRSPPEIPRFSLTSRPYFHLIKGLHINHTMIPEKKNYPKKAGLPLRFPCWRFRNPKQSPEMSCLTKNPCKFHRINHPPTGELIPDFWTWTPSGTIRISQGMPSLHLTRGVSTCQENLELLCFRMHKVPGSTASIQETAGLMGK